MDPTAPAQMLARRLWLDKRFQTADDAWAALEKAWAKVQAARNAGQHRKAARHLTVVAALAMIAGFHEKRTTRPLK